MLFNSIEFLFAFLPITVAAYFLAARWQRRTLAVGILVAASFFFYGWWNPKFLPLLAASIAVNYVIALAIRRTEARRARRSLLVAGIAANLLTLGFFKYSYFVVGNVAAVTGESLSLPNIVLPLGISFYTFQQIAYLVDCSQGRVREYGFLNYCLFVTFFPQLIAGPIVHHGEMMPQFGREGRVSLSAENVAIGLTILAIGLFKKVILADGVAEFANPAFVQAKAGVTVDFVSAWVGALGYTLQLYFDFSGYSDMAIGIARIFNIRLPLNFYSPYKATSITEFWRRWHMTLSRFLRDYLYIPLGGNRLGAARRHVNVMAVMLLGGLWHGAGWTFVFWGGLHGVYLVVNQTWRHFAGRFGWRPTSPAGRRTAAFASWLLTFLCVVFAWVFFRADSFPAAMIVINGMIGAGGFVFPPIVETAVRMIGLGGIVQLPIDRGLGNMELVLRVYWIAVPLAIALYLPNTHQWFAAWHPTTDEYGTPDRRRPVFSWKAGALTAAITAAMLFAVVRSLFQGAPSEFLYFQF